MNNKKIQRLPSNKPTRASKMTPNQVGGLAAIVTGVFLLLRAAVASLTNEPFLSPPSSAAGICLALIVAFAFTRSLVASHCFEKQNDPQNPASEQDANSWRAINGVVAISAAHEVQKSAEIQAWLERVREIEGEK